MSTEQVLTPADQAPDPGLPPTDGAPPPEETVVEDDSSPEQKQLAREQGWRDTDEFDGEPAKFISAKEYLERADHILPILRSRDRESRAALTKLQQDFENLQKDAQQRVEMADARARKELRDRYDGLKAKRAEAVTNGDGAEFERIDGEMTQLLREAVPEKKVEVPADRHSPELQEASAAFLRRNDWFTKDERKNRLAAVVSQEIIAKRPDLKGNPEFFPELERQLKKEYPEMFGNPARTRVDPMVEGNTPPSGPRNIKKGFRDLPKDAQEAGRRQVKSGLCKTEQEYADIYFETYGE